MSDTQSIVQEAEAIVAGVRSSAYGDPLAQGRRIAALANAMGFHRGGNPINYQDVFDFMILVKLGREAHSHKRDNLVDIVGYIICQEKAAELESLEAIPWQDSPATTHVKIGDKEWTQ